MNRTSTFWTGGSSAGRVVILMLGIALVIVPEAFAWGRLYGGGGFGGGGFGGGGFNGGGYAGGGFSGGGAEGSPGGGPAVFTSIRAGGRVRSSSGPIAASATPGPFSKVASIPRIREFQVVRHPPSARRRADCFAEPPGEQPWELSGAPLAVTPEKARPLALPRGRFSAACGGGGGSSRRSFSKVAIWNSSRAR